MTTVIVTWTCGVEGCGEVFTGSYDSKQVRTTLGSELIRSLPDKWCYGYWPSGHCAAICPAHRMKFESIEKAVDEVILPQKKALEEMKLRMLVEKFASLGLGDKPVESMFAIT